MTRRAIWEHGRIVGWRIYAPMFGELVLVGIEYKEARV